MIKQMYLRALIWLNGKSKSASVRLTRLTGKSQVPIHPKHLVTIEENLPWYLDFIEPGMKVLDIGCGQGVHSIRAAHQGAYVVGIDYNWRNLEIGQTLGAADTMSPLTFMMGNVEQPFPFQDNTFDLVLMLDVIEHLHQRIQTLHEIHRVLKSEGILLLAAPNRETKWKRHLRAAGLPSETDPDHKVEYIWPELQDELAQGGFVARDKPLLIVYDTPWAGLIDLVGGFSLGLYERLARWKVLKVQANPQETSGWRVVCRRIEL
jgi:2-polyprenyl-3-methyl-5-hydroxy-6-metoxy-1,4-benzoquinol methylase